MRGTRYIMAIWVACLMAFFGCSKDEPMQNDDVEATTRNDHCTAENDSTKNLYYSVFSA